ncbi:MAG: DJ-1/PfpI family protein [Lysobacterales bacterium]
MTRSTFAVIRLIIFVLFLTNGASVKAMHKPHSQPEVTVAILMFDGVQIIDFAGPYEVFGQAGFGVFTVSERGQAVDTAMGLRTTPDYSLADAPPFDVLLVPGGDVDDASHNKAILDFIRQHSGTQQKILSVCTGSFILAESGVLNGLKATTFYRSLDNFRKDYPKIEVVKGVRWAENDHIITSAGLSSGIDAALHLVAQFRSVEIARSTALHLEYDWQPEQGFVRTSLADQYLPTLDINWPRKTQISSVFSIGDEQHWQRRIRITSSRSLDELLARIDTGMDELTGWARVESGQRKWTRTSDQQGITMQLVHVSSTDDQHQLDVTLDLK